VLLTIIGFAALYTALIVIEMGLMIKAIQHGAEPDDDPEAELISKTLVQAAE
jgi:cytochrome d ubiquinol oxidase subunit I